MKLSIFSILSLPIIIFASCTPDNNGNTATYKDQAFTEHFRQTSGVVAMDGGASIPLNDGRSLFLYGDSYINNYDPGTETVPCLFQVRNAGQTYNINDPSQQSTLTGTGSPASYFQLGTDNDYWFWPQHGYQQGDTVYVFLSRIHHTGGPGGFAFEGVDSNYIAKILYPALTVVGYSLLPSRNGINFGMSVIKEGNQCYVYGKKNNGFGNDVFVARFQADNIYGAWEFRTANGWSANATSAVSFHDEFTSSFSFCKVNNKYAMFTTEFSVGCDQGKIIYSQVADVPYGPFTNRKEIWILDDTLQGHYPFFYLVEPHPEFTSNSELLVTYCINGYGTCVETCNNNRMDPDVYRLKAIRIPYNALQ